ncbi:MAG: cytochrome c biogenesis protein CcdA, partial [Pseudomonadota bacterium]
DGLSGQFGLGLLLGAVWSPCAGPTLGAAVGLAAQRQDLAGVAGIMAVFAMGAAAPVLLLAHGSRGALAVRKEAMARLAVRAKPILGGVLVAVGLLVLTGLDKAIEAAAVAAMPDWLVALTVRF